MSSAFSLINRIGLAKIDSPLLLKRASRLKQWQIVLLLFALLILTTVFIAVLGLDKVVAGLAYSPQGGWFLKKQPLWRMLHDYGTIPGIIFSLGALLTWLMSYYVASLKKWRKPCLVVVLTSVLAAGLIVNAVLKQYWGRPRPSQTIEYGGKWEYREIYNPGPLGKGASFPCGHATMGFVFLAAGGFYQRSRTVAIVGLTTGIVLGGLLSVGRIVQGAHYLSDTLWSFGIVGTVALSLVFFLPESQEHKTETVLSTKDKRQRKWLTIVTVVAMVVMTTGFLTRRPFYKTRDYPLQLADVQRVNIHMNYDPERVQVVYHSLDTGMMRIDAQGFGWIKAEYRQQVDQKNNDNALLVDLDITADSYFAELDHALTLTLPEKKQGQISILLNGDLIN